MSPREDPDNLSKPLAHRLAAMMEAGLLTYREYMPWVDAMIVRMEKPPLWILDLAVTKYRGSAIKVVQGFAHSEPFEHMPMDEFSDECVATIYLRYERRELSWATFLNEAGQIADSYCGLSRHECEYFYEMLNELETAEFAEPVEAKQRSIVAPEHADVIESVRRTFESLKRFGRRVD